MSGKKAYFITANGTGVGKTLVTCALAWQLRQRKQAVRAIKPVASGYPDPEQMGDPEVLLAAQGGDATPSAVEGITPWRFKAPLSPDLAARAEGVTLRLEEIEKFCRSEVQKPVDYVLIEGAGGIMSPLTASHTNRDLAQALAIPAILVTGSYLGAVTHALSAAEALAARSIPLLGVVLSASNADPAALTQAEDMLRRFFPPALPLVVIPRLDFSGKIWEHVPDITIMLEQAQG